MFGGGGGWCSGAFVEAFSFVLGPKFHSFLATNMSGAGCLVSGSPVCSTAVSVDLFGSLGRRSCVYHVQR